MEADEIKSGEKTKKTAQRDVGLQQTNSKSNSAIDIVSQYLKPLESKEMDNITPNWLIDNFLLKESLVMIYAKAGSGKSLFSLALAHHLLESGKVDSVVYLDGDNTPVTLKERGLLSLAKTNGMEYRFLDSDNKKNVGVMFDEMSKMTKKENILIIIDSIRNFIDCDMRDDYGVTNFLHKLQDLRNNGFTIIFLHHQPKQYGDNNKIYKGATAFEDSVDESYFLSQGQSESLGSSEIVFYLEPQKRRHRTKPQGIYLNLQNLTIRQMTDSELMWAGKS